MVLRTDRAMGDSVAAVAIVVVTVVAVSVNSPESGVRVLSCVLPMPHLLALWRCRSKRPRCHSCWHSDCCSPRLHSSCLSRGPRRVGPPDFRASAVRRLRELCDIHVPAPTGGLTVTLTSRNTSVATVPANVTFCWGKPPFHSMSHAQASARQLSKPKRTAGRRRKLLPS